MNFLRKQITPQKQVYLDYGNQGFLSLIYGFLHGNVIHKKERFQLERFVKIRFNEWLDNFINLMILKKQTFKNQELIYCAYNNRYYYDGLQRLINLNLRECIELCFNKNVYFQRGSKPLKLWGNINYWVTANKKVLNLQKPNKKIDFNDKKIWDKVLIWEGENSAKKILEVYFQNNSLERASISYLCGLTEFLVKENNNYVITQKFNFIKEHYKYICNVCNYNYVMCNWFGINQNGYIISICKEFADAYFKKDKRCFKNNRRNLKYWRNKLEKIDCIDKKEINNFIRNIYQNCEYIGFHKISYQKCKRLPHYHFKTMDILKRVLFNKNYYKFYINNNAGS